MLAVPATRLSRNLPVSAVTWLCPKARTRTVLSGLRGQAACCRPWEVQSLLMRGCRHYLHPTTRRAKPGEGESLA